MRKEVQQFAELMNQRLEDNSHKDKYGWKRIPVEDLVVNLDENLYRLIQEEDKEKAIEHATDIANYAMMIADNCKDDES